PEPFVTVNAAIERHHHLILMRSLQVTALERPVGPMLFDQVPTLPHVLRHCAVHVARDYPVEWVIAQGNRHPWSLHSREPILGVVGVSPSRCISQVAFSVVAEIAQIGDVAILV